MISHSGFNLCFSNDWLYWTFFHAIHMSSLRKCLFKSFVHFFIGLLFFPIIEIWEFFIYSRYGLYQMCDLQIFLNSFFWGAEVHNFDEVQRNLDLSCGHKDIFLYFLLEAIALGRSLIHFLLYVVPGIDQSSLYSYPVVPAQFVEKFICSPLNCLWNFTESQQSFLVL